MREILFRGKSEIGKQWIVGNLSQWSDGYMEIAKNENVCERNKFIVNPETIGQYTGLTDKNGKKIFEGDIVEIVSEIGADLVTIPKKARKFVVGWRNEDCGFNLLCWIDYVVIGNIHDNPELLK